MSDPQRTQPRMTIEEFLVWDDGSGISYELFEGRPIPRHVEFVNGRPVAQAAPAAEHAAIVINIGGALWNRLRPPCRAFSEVGIAVSDRDDTWYQADIAVSCAEGRIAGSMLPNPVLVVEVSSPGTAGKDEGPKLTDYCAIPSVQAVLLVAVDRPEVRLIRRVADHWEIEFLRGPDAAARLPFLDVELPLTEIYRGVAFD